MIRIIWQYLLPKHLLSHLIHILARKNFGFLTKYVIKFFVRYYQVNLSEAEKETPEAYHNFNDFFTRALKPNLRVIAKKALVSPVDGIIVQIGRITSDSIISAKSDTYQVSNLIGDKIKAPYFSQGYFMTIYLAPKNYHRCHMPCDAKLSKMTYLPGSLFSVNQTSTKLIPALFTKNERVVCYFDGAFGEIILVLVGAIFVGSVEMIWHGKITPPYRKKIKHWYYENSNIFFQKGEEIGRFNMGSTVILLLSDKAKVHFKKIYTGMTIKMGEAL